MKRMVPILLALLVLPSSSFSVERRGGRMPTAGSITIDLTEPIGSIYRPGEEIRFTFQTERDGYAIVVDIDTDGYVHLLYPQGGKMPERIEGGKKYPLPDYDEEPFVVSGSTGMEFVFGLFVDDRNVIDEQELYFLAENETQPKEKRYRIDGDPMLAANMIAGEIVRGSPSQGLSIGYTYFYINDRVEYPRYLCAECHDRGAKAYEEYCTEYDFESKLGERSGLSYPLSRGYEARSSHRVVESEKEEEEEGETDTHVYINFYPYEAYVYAPPSLRFYYYDPWYWSPLWYDPWWYWDPFYPTSRFSFYFAWGWNWGYWGGYWGWGSYWYPWDYWYWDYGRRYRCYTYRPFRPRQYRYKSALYASTRMRARRDPDLGISTVRYKKSARDVARSSVRSAKLRRASPTALGKKTAYRNREGKYYKAPRYRRDRTHFHKGIRSTRERIVERKKPRSTSLHRNKRFYGQKELRRKTSGQQEKSSARDKRSYRSRSRSKPSSKARSSPQYQRNRSSSRKSYSTYRGSRGSGRQSSGHSPSKARSSSKPSRSRKK